MENKSIKKRKVLLIFIILISIISITLEAHADSSILAWGQYEVQATSPHAETDWPRYLHGAIFNKIFKSPPSYFRKNMRGLIWNQGGRTPNSGHQDNGEEHVIDGAGSDGNTGYSGSWNGSAKFPIKSEVISGGYNFEPQVVNDHIASMDSIIFLKHLCENLGLLCSAPGSALTGSLNYINLKYAENPVSYEHDLKRTSIRTVKTYNVEETEELVAQVANDDLNAEGVYDKLWRTPCQYDGGKSNTCTGAGNGPALAFILSELNNITGNSEKTPLQIAWWHFYNGNAETNTLTQTAQVFQDYINEVKKSDNLDSSRISSTDAKKTGFELDYDPKFKQTNVTQKFDSNQNKYIIGPFKLDYVQYENFAFIYELEVYMNGAKEPIDKSRFKIGVAEKGNNQNLKILEEDEFPDKDTDFYIILDYDENYKYLSDMNVKFQYQNANGNYTIYEGKYSTVNMQGEIYGEYNPEVRKNIEETKEWINEQFRNGYAIVDTDTFSQYYVSDADELLKKYTTIEGGLDDKGLDLNFELTSHKYFRPSTIDFAAGFPTVVTTFGDPICIWSQRFVEMITAYRAAYVGYTNAEDDLKEATTAYNNALNNYNSYVATLSQMDENNPMYDSYVNLRNNASSDMANALGDMADARRQKAGALKNMGDNLEYGKRAYDLWENKPDYISGYYPGAQYKGPSKRVPRPLEFVIWKDYTYTVVDKDLPAQTQAVAGTANRWWELKELHWVGGPTKPKTIPESAQIKITKQLTGDEEIKDGTTFKFKVNVSGAKNSGTEDLTITWINGADNYVLSPMYYWEVEVDERTGKIKEETRPTVTYSVEEGEMPEGFTLQGISNSSGKLENGQIPTAEAIVKNSPTTEDYEGDLEITKKITKTELGVEEYSIKNQKFKFRVTISGKFRYKGTWYSNDKPYVEEIEIGISDLENGIGKWKSDKIYWTEKENPTYKVEEIIPENSVSTLIKVERCRWKNYKWRNVNCKSYF